MGVGEIGQRVKRNRDDPPGPSRSRSWMVRALFWNAVSTRPSPPFLIDSSGFDIFREWG